MSFETQIQQISTEELDNFFAASPEGSPTAKDLIAGEEIQSHEQIGAGSLDNIDLASIPDAGTEDDAEPAEPVVPVAETPVEPAAPAEPTEPAEPVEPTEGDEPAAEGDEIKTVLKSTVDYLIEQGHWVDFEGREDLEITNEVYAELAVKQNQQAAYEIVNELIDSTGNYGKAIISHIKAGGNPDDVIDIFKAQKEVEQIDTSEEAGKQTLIEKYYKDVLGWRTERVAKTVNKLIEDNEIDSEFEDVKGMYEQHHAKQLNDISERTKAQEAEKIAKQEAFKTSIKEAINSSTDLTPKERQAIQSSILDFKHKLDNGQKVNDFYLKFAEMQADPKKYIELTQFVTDPEGYKAKLQSKAKTVAEKAAFTFIKGNRAVAKPASASVQISDTGKPAGKGTDFSLALKQR